MGGIIGAAAAFLGVSAAWACSMFLARCVFPPEYWALIVVLSPLIGILALVTAVPAAILGTMIGTAVAERLAGRTQGGSD